MSESDSDVTVKSGETTVEVKGIPKEVWWVVAGGFMTAVGVGVAFWAAGPALAATAAATAAGGGTIGAVGRKVLRR